MRRRRIPLRVSAQLARDHIFHLGSYGLGIDSIAAASDVGTDTIWRIRNGQQRILARTEQRILAVTPEAVSDGVRVDATVTKNLIRELLEEGYSPTMLSREMGGSSGHLPWLKRKRVWARTEMRAEKLYRRLMFGGKASA